MQWNHEVLVTGADYPEGPVYLGDGVIAFTEVRGQRVSRWSKDRGYEIIAHTGGGANAATLGPDGALYVTNNGGMVRTNRGKWINPVQLTGRIQRITLDGEVADIVTDLPATAPQRPNDLCFGPDGCLYFTDPHNFETLKLLKPGRIWRAQLDGSVELLAEVPDLPNGIAFGPDDRLYVAQSVQQRILSFEVIDRLGPPTVHCVLPSGYPDGFCFSKTGDLYVCGSFGCNVCVFDRSGSLKEEISLGEGTDPTNCCFGDGDLYVTLAGVGAVWRFSLGIEGLELYPARLALAV